MAAERRGCAGDPGAGRGLELSATRELVCCWRLQGEYAGTISGGCLETEVLRKASWLVRDGAVVERYSTMFDDTAEVPFGLGCGGVVDLLLEPADTPECRALMTALEGGACRGGGDSVDLVAA